jgi:hypothetical protein
MSNTFQFAGATSAGKASQLKRESANKETPSPSLITLARAALSDAGNDTELAAETLAARLEEPEIRRALALDAVKTVAQSAIGSVRAYERQAIENGRQVGKVLARAAAVDRSFMAWPLPFGGVLGDATADELRRAIEHYNAASASMQRRAAWLEKIVNALPVGRKVRDALTEKQLADWSNGQ